MGRKGEWGDGVVEGEWWKSWNEEEDGSKNRGWVGLFWGGVGGGGEFKWHMMGGGGFLDGGLVIGGVPNGLCLWCW
uniref:Uncharacterized protein n=1 Tax=Knipowitschia caucasica TaxID=637954 RepID=A0AAV2LVY4_KNICA